MSAFGRSHNDDPNCNCGGRPRRPVDEDMIVLRKRIHEMKMVERNYEPPADWMVFSLPASAAFVILHAANIRQSLPDFGIRPGDQGKVEDVIELVKAFTGAEPEIACNRNSITKDVQLWEIRLCYDKPDPQGQGGLVHQIRNCPFPLSHYPGELKLQLEAFFSYVILRLAQGKYGASYQQQEIAMKALADFCRQKTFMVEIVNCPLSAMHILALDGVMAERIGNGSVSSEQAPVILRECLSGGENTSKDV
ncbi:hypothetical protein V6N12_000988 [Hibiscus sabdariffa]|uniref:Mon2/Sec7/BIG1-like HUS domain-containing protein n=1 Tax=Hibiscus sabdariffa TaxID=183260 RepID=A0ABR2AWS2_9ROSI